jgi:uncharacterized protein YdeI (YjbR/CyaY-like superfamily)
VSDNFTRLRHSRDSTLTAMSSRDPRIDAYIENSADFAKPILRQMRETIHAAAPATEETIKWGFPHFMYGGKILCSMAAFKEHCALHFWKGDAVLDQTRDTPRQSMGQFGRLRKLSDLPSKKVMSGYVKKAVKLNEERAESPPVPKPKKKRPALATPASLERALKKNRKAKATFDSMSPSHRREYVEWITEAKTDATRDKRTATTIQWLTEGKPLNWKYGRT